MKKPPNISQKEWESLLALQKKTAAKVKKAAAHQRKENERKKRA